MQRLRIDRRPPRERLQDRTGRGCLRGRPGDGVSGQLGEELGVGDFRVVAPAGACESQAINLRKESAIVDFLVACELSDLPCRCRRGRRACTEHSRSPPYRRQLRMGRCSWRIEGCS